MTFRSALVGLVAAAVVTGCGRPAPTAAAPAEPARGRPIADRLAAPVPALVEGAPLVRDGYDRLVPFVGDIEGNGGRALLLGTSVAHGEGRLLVYRDTGTGGVRLAAPQWFDDIVPTGRIPRG